MNATPTDPDITGKINGEAGTPYDYTFVSTDDDGDELWYYIEWGDGSIEEWIGPYASGENVIVSHTWTDRDTYTIRAKARYIYGFESDWSTLEIQMPLVHGLFLHNFLVRILSRFPLINQLLQQLFF